jgi:cysteine desulfurase
VAALIHADPREIVWTSGATESVNLALRGVFDAAPGQTQRLVTSVIEHSAVHETAQYLARQGAVVTTVGVDGDGLVDPGLGDALDTPATLVSIIAASNEIGTVQPLAEIGALCRERGSLFHTDAAQAAGKVPIDVEAMSIDLMSLSAHKMHGPKGVGALYVRRRGPRVRLAPQLFGGGQQAGRRPGTLNVPGIVGFGRACAICAAEPGVEAVVAEQRDALVAEILGAVPGARLNGHPTRRLPGNASLYFPGVPADALLAALPDVAVSAGSACASGSITPSPVLLALSGPDDLPACTIRVGLSRMTTEEERRTATNRIVEEVRRLQREQSPATSLGKRGERVAGTVRQSLRETQDDE